MFRSVESEHVESSSVRQSENIPVVTCSLGSNCSTDPPSSCFPSLPSPSPWLCTGLPPVWWDSVTTSSFVLLRSTNSSNSEVSNQILRTETCCLPSSANTANKYTEYCKVHIKYFTDQTVRILLHVVVTFVFSLNVFLTVQAEKI